METGSGQEQTSEVFVHGLSSENKTPGSSTPPKRHDGYLGEYTSKNSAITRRCPEFLMVS